MFIFFFSHCVAKEEVGKGSGILELCYITLLLNKKSKRLFRLENFVQYHKKNRSLKNNDYLQTKKSNYVITTTNFY